MGSMYIDHRLILEDFFAGREVDEVALRMATSWFKREESRYSLHFLNAGQWALLENICSDPHMGVTISLDKEVGGNHGSS